MSILKCRVMILNSFILSGNRVKCLIKCHHCSLVFFLSGIVFSNCWMWMWGMWFTSCGVVSEGYRCWLPGTSYLSLLIMWHLSLPFKATFMLTSVPLSLSEMPSLPVVSILFGCHLHKTCLSFWSKSWWKQMQIASKSHSFSWLIIPERLSDLQGWN